MSLGRNARLRLGFCFRCRLGGRTGLLCVVVECFIGLGNGWVLVGCLFLEAVVGNGGGGVR